MNRAKSLRTAAKILHESLKNVEQSPDVNPGDPQFARLKSTVLEQEVKLQEKAAAIETPFPGETTD